MITKEDIDAIAKQVINLDVDAVQDNTGEIYEYLQSKLHSVPSAHQELFNILCAVVHAGLVTPNYEVVE